MIFPAEILDMATSEKPSSPHKVTQSWDKDLEMVGDPSLTSHTVGSRPHTTEAKQTWNPGLLLWAPSSFLTWKSGQPGTRFQTFVTLSRFQTSPSACSPVGTKGVCL